MSFLFETEIQCPHCGELYSLIVDTTQGDHSTIEDCPICCRPINLNFHCSPGRVYAVEVCSD